MIAWYTEEVESSQGCHNHIHCQRSGIEMTVSQVIFSASNVKIQEVHFLSKYDTQTQAHKNVGNIGEPIFGNGARRHLCQHLGCHSIYF